MRSFVEALCSEVACDVTWMSVVGEVRPYLTSDLLPRQPRCSEPYAKTNLHLFDTDGAVPQTLCFEDSAPTDQVTIYSEQPEHCRYCRYKDSDMR